MDPTTAAQGLTTYGLAYVLAAVSIVAAVVIIHLYREVGKLRDRIEALHETHQDVVVGLLKGQLAVTDETRDLLIKILAAMERMQPRP